MTFLASLLATALPLAANGQAQLLPAGKFSARDGRPGPDQQWSLDDTQGLKLSEAMNAICAKTPISIDYEHQTLLAAKNGQPAPAAGWILKTVWRAGEGLFAEVNWTERAAALIAGNEYRYISPVILYDKAGNITGVHNAALVSTPALLGMEPVQAALAALAADPSFNPHRTAQEALMDLAQLVALLGLSASATAADVSAKIGELMGMAKMAEAMCSALGLQTGADEAAALAAVQRLAATPDAATVATVAELQRQLTALNAQIVERTATEAVDGAIAAGKLMPAMRAWALTLGKHDMAQLRTFIAAAVPIPGLRGQGNTGDPIIDGNRDDGDTQDAHALARQALAYQSSQAAAGVPLSTAQAVRAVAAGAK